MLGFQKVINQKNLLLVSCTFVLFACKKDKEYEVPTTYAFENVSYSGQTTRLDMVDELLEYIESAHTPNASALDVAKLKDMYANSNNRFADNALNTSGKQIKDKVADAEQGKFDTYLEAVATASLATANTNPANGAAGIYMKNDGSKGYLLNANGVELTEIIEKGLMGAFLYYQTSAVYLGSGKMEVDNAMVITGEGTAMEHHWDEAFGYFGVSPTFPTNVTDVRYWGKYCNSRNALLGSNPTIMNAFLTGRAAISNDDLERRDEMINTIRSEWERVAAATAISYLNDAKESFTSDPAVKHHTLSEAFGFIYALQFGGDASLSAAEVNALLVGLAGSADPLQANFYNTTTTQIEAATNSLIGFFPSLASFKDTL